MNLKLREVVLEGDAAALRQLLEKDPLLLGRTLDGSLPETPLHVAILRGHTRFAVELLEQEPRLAEICDESGNYPLHLASTRGYRNLVKKIIRAEPSLISTRDKQGRTSTHLAAIQGQIDVLKELLLVKKKKKILSQEVTSVGETPLHLCVKHNQIEAAKFLIEKDEELVNLQDDNGNTVLHLAVVRKQSQMVKVLLDVPNVDVNAKNGYDFTPLDVLLQTPSESGDREITELLLHAGAKRGQRTNRVRSSSKTPWTLKAALKASWNNWYKRDEVWLNEMHNTLMVVATLIATITFQTGLNPPGGVWQDSVANPTSSAVGEVKPGTAIGNDVNFNSFKFFMYFDMIGLAASLTVILMLVSGLPLKTRFTTWLLVIAMLIALSSMTMAFVFGTVVITVSENILRKIPYILSIWLGLLAFILLSHFTMIAFSVWRKLKRSELSVERSWAVKKRDIEPAEIDTEHKHLLDEKLQFIL